MKLILIRASILTLLLLVLLSPNTILAEKNSYLDHDGKMELQLDRVDQSKQEKSDEIKKDGITELEKYAPNLFKEETTEVIEKKMTQMNKEINDLSNTLFTQSVTKETPVQEIQKTLFSQAYTTENVVESNKSKSQEVEDSVNVKVMLFLFVVVMVICYGLYMVTRRIWQ